MPLGDGSVRQVCQPLCPQLNSPRPLLPVAQARCSHLVRSYFPVTAVRFLKQSDFCTTFRIIYPDADTGSDGKLRASGVKAMSLPPFANPHFHTSGKPTVYGLGRIHLTGIGSKLTIKWRREVLFFSFQIPFYSIGDIL